MPSRRSKTTKTYHPQYPASDSTPKDDRNNPKLQHPAALADSSLLVTPAAPPNWPPSLPYLTHPILSPYLPQSHLKWLRTRPQPPDEELSVIVLPASPSDVQPRIEIRVIEDSGHPAFGQRGLFAARDLAPGELVTGYLGFVHGRTGVERGEYERRAGEGGSSDGLKHDDARGGVHVDTCVDTATLNEAPRKSGIGSVFPSMPAGTTTSTSMINTSLIGTWDTSSYDLNMYRADDIEIAVDALIMGNEARFVNDYRGVPVQRRELGENGAGVGEVERRKGKRRVKGWEDGSGSGAGVWGDEYRAGDGEGMEVQHGGNTGAGQWGTGSYNNRFDIAMPNAEFRDVWFDIPGDIDLTLEVSVSSHNHHPSENGEVNNVGAVLKDVHLDDNRRKFDTTVDQDKEIIATSTNTEEKSKSRPRRKKKNGIRGVAVFVMPTGKSGKRKGGIKKGQEVLVSYGKGFWAHHGLENGEG